MRINSSNTGSMVIFLLFRQEFIVRDDGRPTSRSSDRSCEISDWLTPILSISLYRHLESFLNTPHGLGGILLEGFASDS